MAERTPTLAQVIDDAIASRQSELLFALPGEVTSYSANTQTCSVRLLVKDAIIDEYGERQAKSFANVTGVPYIFPNAEDYSITFPVSTGSPVLVLFMSRSIDKWKSLGGEVDPGDDRRYNISDAVAIPGLRARTQPLPSSARDNNALVVAVPTGKELKLGSSGPLEPTVKGTTYRSAEDTFLAALNTYLAAIVTALPVPGSVAAATTVFTTALGIFQGGAAGYLTQKVKVE